MSLIVVSVGTDHHKFDRLMDWVDAWNGPESEFIIQRGTSKESALYKGESLIPHGELCQLFATADVVISHGGPSTVMDVRKAGKMPIVVPRDPAYGEHIDNHQMLFAEHLKKTGVARVATEQDQLYSLINLALKTPEDFWVSKRTGSLPGVLKFGEIVDNILSTNTPIVPNTPADLNPANVSDTNDGLKGVE